MKYNNLKFDYDRQYIPPRVSVYAGRVLIGTFADNDDLERNVRQRWLVAGTLKKVCTLAGCAHFKPSCYVVSKLI